MIANMPKVMSDLLLKVKPGLLYSTHFIMGFGNRCYSCHCERREGIFCLCDCFVASLRLGRAARLELADKSRRGLTMAFSYAYEIRM
jgi:hypothetical protein